VETGSSRECVALAEGAQVAVGAIFVKSGKSDSVAPF
jgi:hypothetical protein